MFFITRIFSFVSQNSVHTNLPKYSQTAIIQRSLTSHGRASYMTDTFRQDTDISAEQSKIRQTFERIFWDIDVSQLDFEKNYRLIITQVINYGYVAEIQTLFKVYPKDTIRQVLENPLKGVWEPKTYKAFCNLLDVEPQKKAINRLFVEKTRKKMNKLFIALLSPQI